MAAGVFRTYARRGRIDHMLDIAAAGTFDGHAGEPPSLMAREVAQHRGYELAPAAVQALKPEDLAHYDHAIAMDRTVLAAMRWMAPAGCTGRPQLLMRHMPEGPARSMSQIPMAARQPTMSGLST